MTLTFTDGEGGDAGAQDEDKKGGEEEGSRDERRSWSAADRREEVEEEEEEEERAHHVAVVGFGTKSNSISVWLDLLSTAHYVDAIAITPDSEWATVSWVLQLDDLFSTATLNAAEDRTLRMHIQGVLQHCLHPGSSLWSEFLRMRSLLPPKQYFGVNSRHKPVDGVVSSFHSERHGTSSCFNWVWGGSFLSSFLPSFLFTYVVLTYLLVYLMFSCCLFLKKQAFLMRLFLTAKRSVGRHGVSLEDPRYCLCAFRAPCRRLKVHVSKHSAGRISM